MTSLDGRRCIDRGSDAGGGIIPDATAEEAEFGLLHRESIDAKPAGAGVAPGLLRPSLWREPHRDGRKRARWPARSRSPSVDPLDRSACSGVLHPAKAVALLSRSAALEVPVPPGCDNPIGWFAMRASMHRIAVSLMGKTKRQFEALLIRAWPASKTNVRKAHFVFRWPALDGSVFIATPVSGLRLR
jgi:hypothetical protein